MTELVRMLYTSNIRPPIFLFLYLDFVFSIKYEGQDFYVGVGL